MQEIGKEKMKGVVALEYGETNPKFQMRKDLPKPVFKKRNKMILVKVLAASIGYGDIHMLSGKVKTVLKVQGGFPYILGKDLCGVVEDADEGSKFKKGDIVVGQTPQIAGTIAEYVLVPEKQAAHKPQNVGIYEAAASVDSSNTAYYSVVKVAKIQPKERVLILGGSGGVGSAAVQLAKIQGASFIDTTSTQNESLEKLGADFVIDYTKKNWWEIEEFQTENKFDVLIDCVGGADNYNNSVHVVKSRRNGGRFIPVCGDQPNPRVQNVFELIGFAINTLKNPIVSTFNRDLPDYSLIITTPDPERMQLVLDLIAKKQLNISFEKNGPYQFSKESVQKAFMLQASHHAHGKIVIKISDF